MPRGALGPTIAVVALVGATWPAAVRAQTPEVTLPRLEVPDEVRRKAVNPERAALLNQPIELSDARDRLTLARERAAWGRMSGSLCSGCVSGPALRRTVTVDPIAVLNAKPAAKPAARPAAVLTAAPAFRPVRPPAPAATAVAATAPAPIPTAPAPIPTASAPTPTAPARAPAAGAVQASAGPVRIASATAAVPAAAITVRRRPSIVMRRSARPAHAHRARFAHRRRHTRLSQYLARVRYTLFRRHDHRRPQRNHR